MSIKIEQTKKKIKNQKSKIKNSYDSFLCFCVFFSVFFWLVVCLSSSEFNTAFLF